MSHTGTSEADLTLFMRVQIWEFRLPESGADLSLQPCSSAPHFQSQASWSALRWTSGQSSSVPVPASSEPPLKDPTGSIQLTMLDSELNPLEAGHGAPGRGYS